MKSTEHNPGKYDEVCTLAREVTKAEGVILIVFKGLAGDGFSVQATEEVLKRMPSILETIAGEIRKDMEP